MSLNAYQVACTVAEEKSFVSAARVLHITPSAVSHCISSLETRFGLLLFKRDNHGAALTTEGRRLISYFQSILETEECLNQEVALMQKLDIGTVKIGVFNSACASWMPDIIQTFRAQFPRIEIVLYQGGYDVLASWLENKTVDLAITSISCADDTMNVTQLYRDQMVCIARQGFTPIHGTYVTGQDLKNTPLISMRPGDDSDAQNVLRHMQVDPVTPIQAMDDMSIVALVKCGMGHCILSRLLMDLFPKDYLSDLRIFPFEPPEYRTICLVHPKTSRLSPAVYRMKQHIIDFMAKKQPPHS